MQATLPPAWATARRRRGRVALAELGELAARAHQLHLQMTLQELRRLRELHARPDLLLYSPSRLRQLVRLGMVGETGHGASPAPGWRPGPLGAPWRLPDADPSPETLSVGAGGAGEAGGAGGGGAGAAGAGWSSYCGWGAGALLLLAALLLVRVTDRCFMRNFNAARRRRSEEWPTPNVLATSHDANFAGSNDAEAGAVAGESSYVVCVEDLPPPYAEVSAAKREDPPPPYSDCYVVFHDPDVHFLTAHDEPGTFRGMQNLDIAHSSNHCHVPSPQADNPIGSRIDKIPYADSTSTDNGEESGEERGESGTVRAGDDVSYISITDDVDTQSNRYR